MVAITVTGAMPTYNYMQDSPYGPDEWGTLSPSWELCKYGQEQSPIAIDVLHSTVNQSLGSLQYTYMPSAGVLINLGHAVQVSTKPSLHRRTGHLQQYKHDHEDLIVYPNS